MRPPTYCGYVKPVSPQAAQQGIHFLEKSVVFLFPKRSVKYALLKDRKRKKLLGQWRFEPGTCHSIVRRTTTCTTTTAQVNRIYWYRSSSQESNFSSSFRCRTRLGKGFSNFAPSNNIPRCQKTNNTRLNRPKDISDSFSGVEEFSLAPIYNLQACIYKSF